MESSWRLGVYEFGIGPPAGAIVGAFGTGIYVAELNPHVNVGGIVYTHLLYIQGPFVKQLLYGRSMFGVKWFDIIGPAPSTGTTFPFGNSVFPD